MRVGRVGVRLAAVPVAAVAAGMHALAGCGSGPYARFAAEAARTADVIERVSAPGSVQAAAQSDLHAPAAAKLADLRVHDGQRVQRGQVVAQLSSTQVDSSIRQARAALDSASALDGLVPSVPVASALAAIEQVQQQLSATQAAELAVAAVDQQTVALRSALDSATAAQRGQAQLALDLAMEQKAELTLRAPISGTLQLGRASSGGAGATSLPDLSQLPESAQQAVQGLAGGSGGQSAAGPPLRAGDQIAAGQTVATVYDVSDLQVAAEVDETDIALVRPGQPADVQLDAFPGASFPARVRRVAVAPSSSQSAAGGVTYEVDLVLAAGDGPAPRVGMTATADIQVRQARDALSVPGSALIGRDRGQQAVLVIEGGKVHLRDVRVSVDGDDRAAIAAGLRQGERVVSRGAERLHDGESWPGS